VRTVRSLAPIFEQASTTHRDIVFGEADTEAEQSLAATPRSRPSPPSWPSVKASWSSASPAPCPPLPWSRSSPQIRELDMDDIRAQSGQSQATATTS
jgi:thioredoxin 1